MRSKKRKGPQFLRFIGPLIAVLQKLDGSGNASEVVDEVIDMMGIPEKVLEEKLNSGGSRVKNQIYWARMYLVKANYIDSSKWGIWRLTEKGLKSKIPSDEEVYKIFRTVQDSYIKKTNTSEISSQNEIEKKDNSEDFLENEITETEGHKEKLLQILQELPPDGFERLCQRLLRESGFQRVKVIGKSGDGGIDGEGILAINPLVSFKVIFQSKRYKGSVSASDVRDFRGAMQGRAEKGIIITTGRFTQEAKKEAIRDGAPPIELVDGDDLVKLFEEKELGLINPRTVYDIDDEFFDEFR
jgi:restriction system protein